MRGSPGSGGSTRRYAHRLRVAARAARAERADPRQPATEHAGSSNDSAEPAEPQARGPGAEPQIPAATLPAPAPVANKRAPISAETLGAKPDDAAAEAVAASKFQSPAAAPAPPGTVDRRSVAAAVRTHQTEIQGCYERAKMDGTELHGRLTVTATIDPNGHVVSASANNGVTSGARLQACVVSAFKSWTLPSPAGGVSGEITYGFNFR